MDVMQMAVSGAEADMFDIGTRLKSNLDTKAVAREDIADFRDQMADAEWDPDNENHTIEFDIPGEAGPVAMTKAQADAHLKGLDDKERWSLQLAGGDDYELCFTVPPESASELAEISRSCGAELTIIGAVNERHGLEFKTSDGALYDPGFAAFQHFQENH